MSKDTRSVSNFCNQAVRTNLSAVTRARSQVKTNMEPTLKRAKELKALVDTGLKQIPEMPTAKELIEEVIDMEKDDNVEIEEAMDQPGPSGIARVNIPSSHPGGLGLNMKPKEPGTETPIILDSFKETSCNNIDALSVNILDIKLDETQIGQVIAVMQSAIGFVSGSDLLDNITYNNGYLNIRKKIPRPILHPTGPITTPGLSTRHPVPKIMTSSPSDAFKATMLILVTWNGAKKNSGIKPPYNKDPAKTALSHFQKLGKLDFAHRTYDLTKSFFM